MRDEKRPGVDETLAPSRNFTITTADRVRAAAGPPAYMRRKRHIEDLTASLRAAVVAALARAGGDAEAARRAIEGHAPSVKALRELNRLIVAHNRFYPIEANLPFDPATRESSTWRPYKPLAAVTLCDVIADVIAEVVRRSAHVFADVLSACGASSHVGKIR